MNLIVAADKNWAIGNRGRLLVTIPEDQKLFRQETLGKHSHMDEYRARCFILGQRVTFLRDERQYEGVAETILDDGALQVRLDSGESMILQSGEVSVRPC